ncbi:MAG: hypothetical protein ACK42L_07365 [Thermoanaerobaculum sp.]
MAAVVVIAHNPVPAGADPATADVLEQVAAVAEALEDLGIAYELCEVTDPTAVEPFRGKIVFNLFEAAPGQFQLPLAFAQALETAGIPFTGSASEVLTLTTNKVATRKRLAQFGIPVAPGGVAFQDLDLVPPPWLAKPAWEDASLGLEGNPVCFTPEDLEQRVAHLAQRFPGQEILLEHFLPGREFNVSLLAAGNTLEVLPVAEIAFVDFPPNVPPLVSYEAKWEQGSFADTHTVRVFPPAEDPVVSAVRELALQAALACGVCGYARVDLRCNEKGTPCVLEVNANPCLATGAGFLAAAAQKGLKPSQVVARILAAAGVECA